MSRGVGPYQEHILAVLAGHDRPMTEQEIAMVLTSTGELPSRDYQDNLSRALVGLADRRLIGLELGHWDRPHHAEDVGSGAVPGDGGRA
jgi:hypothetical protein